MNEEDRKESKMLLRRLFIFAFLFIYAIGCAVYAKITNTWCETHLPVVALMGIVFMASLGAYTGHKQASEEIATEWWKYRDKP